MEFLKGYTFYLGLLAVNHGIGSVRFYEHHLLQILREWHPNGHMPVAEGWS